MSYYPTSSRIIYWIIKHSRGFIKNKKQAFTVLLIILVIIFVVSFYLIIYGNITSKKIESTKYNPYSGYGGRELPDDFR